MVARRGFSILLLVCISTAAGCFTPEEWRRFWDFGGKGAQPDPEPRQVSKSKATRGTIGEQVTIEGLRFLQVRGFGLVMDLPGTGGSDGPEPVKKHLAKEMRRTEKPGEPGLSATDTLAGRDTAMVEVTGLVPAASKKGDRFDVVVRALGTQTNSLAGGRLVLCNLKAWADTLDGVLGGKTVATATGPIFISPVGLREEIPEKIDLRTGLVLGGGAVTRPRSVRLVLNDPSPSIARRIVNRINGRHAASDPVAVALSHTSVELKIPKAYLPRKRLFVEHVLHTPLNADPAVLKRRAKDLAQEITHPDAEFESIALAFETTGRIALPDIQELYHHALPAAGYFAGRAGLRLGDRAGMEAVAKHAMDRGSPFRNAAIDELGHAVRMHGAGEYLRQLLNDPDPAVRLRAYKALRRRPHPAVESNVLYDDNLILDVVDSSAPYLIYVQRSTAPRIAIFGRHMRCRPPAIYPGDRNGERFLQTQISAKLGDDHLTVIFTNKRSGRTSPELSASLTVAKLVRFLGDAPTKNADGQLEGLGAPYDEIVDILHTFCQLGTIPATFIAEDLTGAEDIGREDFRERKESEY